MTPRITVLMAIYNCGPYLPEALDSLLAQSYQGFKVILCDDGSADNTYEIARKYADCHPDKFILVSNERNMGLNYSLNHCLKYADTEYVARMDGDDVSLPTRFEKEIEFLDLHKEYDIVSSPMIYFDEDGDFMTGHGGYEVTKRHFIPGSPICHAPCMARTEAFKKVGGYSVNPRLLRVEDYHLWFKLYASGSKAYMMNEPLYKMRDDRNATARRNWRNRLNEAYVRHIGYRMIGLPVWTQIYCLRPLIVALLPGWLYNKLHRKSL